MLVEDDQAHAELVQRSLESHQAANRMIHMVDGEAALDYLFQRGAYADPDQNPRPCLVLLDLRLPKVDGLEVLKTIKTSKELKSLPVVILTTSEAEMDIAKAYEHHANSYLVKPADFSTFTDMIRGMSFYWLTCNRSPWSRGHGVKPDSGA